MANFGASKPWISKLNGQTGLYEKAFKCGEMVNTSVNPQYNTATLYGDNRKVEEVRMFKSADITLGVTRLPVQAAEIMFGHKILEDGSEVLNTGDDGNYVGYAFIVQEMKSGSKKYRACLIYKAKFNEGQADYESQAENLTFKTPSISGSALSKDNGDWCVKSPYFETEDETEAWIKKQLGVEENVTEPPADDNSGSTGNEQQGNTEETLEDIPDSTGDEQGGTTEDPDEDDTY